MLTEEQRIRRNIKKNAYRKQQRREHPKRFRQRERVYYRANPWKFVSGRAATEMREVILILTGRKPKRGLKLGILYDLMETIIKKRKKFAARKFPFGRPDAFDFRVEWKFGFDRLRACQFVWNVLNGLSCGVRWAPSCDDFERAMAGKKSDSRFFKSYKDFVVWNYGIDNVRNKK